MLERDLERGLIEHLRAMILELGKGFAFVGSQYHLEVGGQDYYLDLLFYHLRLRCFVVIELKIEDFKPEFAGKMNFYLSAVDDQLRHPDDQNDRHDSLQGPQRGDRRIHLARHQQADGRRAIPPLAGPAATASTRPADRRGAGARISAHVRRQAAHRDRADLAGFHDPQWRHARIDWRNQRDGERLAEARDRTRQRETVPRSLRVMLEASHGVDVDGTSAQRAIDVGTTFLAELRELRARGGKDG